MAEPNVAQLQQQLQRFQAELMHLGQKHQQDIGQLTDVLMQKSGFVGDQFREYEMPPSPRRVIEALGQRIESMETKVESMCASVEALQISVEAGQAWRWKIEKLCEKALSSRLAPDPSDDDDPWDLRGRHRAASAPAVEASAQNLRMAAHRPNPTGVFPHNPFGIKIAGLGDPSGRSEGTEDNESGPSCVSGVRSPGSVAGADRLSFDPNNPWE